MIRLLAAAALTVTTGAGAADPGFYEYWGDGRAELSSYRIIQPRYGELRDGFGVMVFVTEDLNRQTLIKVESPTSESDRRYTLKLNNLIRFNTGIYDYSVMTSVFSFVRAGEGGFGRDRFDFAKVSLTAQEWCGHVFDEVRATPDQLHGRLASYFEAEGNRDYRLQRPDSFVSEDELLIRIRELDGELMSSGETQQLQLLPSLWQLRMGHQEHALVPALLKKGEVEEHRVGGRDRPAVPWTWTVEEGKRSVTVWVASRHPRHILAWDSSDGGRGELLTSVREPYWRLQGNADEVMRERLQLPR